MTSQAHPPFLRSSADETLVRSGKSVSANGTWAQIGALANWLQGQGACLVAGCGGDQRNLNKNGTYTLHFRTLTRTVNIQRVWAIALRSPNSLGTPAQVTIAAGAGAAALYTAPGYRGSFWGSVAVYVENLSGRSNTETDLTLIITTNPNDDIAVDAISCWECPRPALNYDTVDRGVDITTLASGQRIYDTGGAANASVAQCFSTLANTDPRRVSLLAWAVPAESPTLFTSATPQNVFALPVPILQRILALGATTAQVSWSVYAAVASGGTGQVKFSTDGSGVNDTVSFTNTSLAWTPTRTVSVDCEDLTAQDGRRSSRWDGMQFALFGDGTHQCQIAGISVWDATS